MKFKYSLVTEYLLLERKNVRKNNQPTWLIVCKINVDSLDRCDYANLDVAEEESKYSHQVRLLQEETSTLRTKCSGTADELVCIMLVKHSYFAPNKVMRLSSLN